MAARSRRRGSPRVTLIFLVLLSLTIITLDFRGDGGGAIERVRGTTADALSPVRRAADTVLTPVGDAFSGVTGYGSLQRQNDQLRKQIAQLQGQQFANQNAQMERDQLLALNGLQDQLGSYRRVTARVVSAPVSNFEQTIELDVGSNRGVGVDMPVVTGAGLVGRVVEVSGSRSVVRLITDPASSVGVRLVTTGEAGIADGEGPHRDLSVSYVSADSAVTVGELLVTSGLAGGSDLYPAGIPVGKVHTATQVEGELDKRIRIVPVADLDHLVFVQVVITR
ncbi:MAG TPA: rod shape-determining protein MreC [Acidimicrobiales bacterium]